MPLIPNDPCDLRDPRIWYREGMASDSGKQQHMLIRFLLMICIYQKPFHMKENTSVVRGIDQNSINGQMNFEDSGFCDIILIRFEVHV